MIESGPNGTALEHAKHVAPNGADVDMADAGPRFRLNDFVVLLKPRIMSLVVLTGLVGLLMAPGGRHGDNGSDGDCVHCRRRRCRWCH